MPKIHALPIRKHAAEVHVSAYIRPDGSPGLFWTGNPERPREGDGGYHAVELWMLGRSGGMVGVACLTSRDCRALAVMLETEAALLDNAIERKARLARIAAVYPEAAAEARDA